MKFENRSVYNLIARFVHLRGSHCHDKLEARGFFQLHSLIRHLIGQNSPNLMLYLDYDRLWQNFGRNCLIFLPSNGSFPVGLEVQQFGSCCGSNMKSTEVSSFSIM